MTAARTNIYNALYYCKDQTQSYEDFVGEVFHTDIPLPAAQQKKNFEAILTSTLEEDCSFDVVQQMHEQLSEMIEVHKESRAEEPLLISQGQVRQVLAQCQVPEEKLAKFAVQMEEDFGLDAQLSRKTSSTTRHFALKTPDVTIQVNPARSDLVQTGSLTGSSTSSSTRRNPSRSTASISASGTKRKGAAMQEFIITGNDAGSAWTASWVRRRRCSPPP